MALDKATTGTGTASSHRALALKDGELFYTDRGTGSPIMLVHGSLCDLRYWRWQADALAEHHRVIIPSLMGCWPGRNKHPYAGYSIDAHAKDLVHLATALDLDNLCVLGHSRGAHVALAMALARPEICSALVLADPGFRFGDEPETRAFYTDAVRMLKSGDTESAMRSFIDTVNGELTWDRMAPWFKEMVRDNACTLISQIAEAMLPASAEDIAHLDLPLLLVTGANSPSKYRTRLERILQLRPDARKKVIPLAAHGMNLANPRAFNQAITDFVQATSRHGVPPTNP